METTPMMLTIGRSDGSSPSIECTYAECLDALEEGLKEHYLLTASEREECVEAVERIRRTILPQTLNS